MAKNQPVTKKLDIEKVQKGFASQREFSYWIPECDVEGQIPEDLVGTFIRNGPGINEVYGKRLKHPIDGDGMVCKLSFVNGKAHFCSKFVQSKHRKDEESERKFIYPGQMGTRDSRMISDTLGAFKSVVTGKFPSLNFRNPSNTNAFYWGGKILALYETHLPHCLDPFTLETLGLDDLNGNLTLGNAAVHFRIDPKKMNLVMFSLRPGLRKKPALQIVEFDQQWKLQKKLTLNIPGLNYSHDFLLFPDYYLFHMTPFTEVTIKGAFEILAGWTSPGETMRYYPHLPSKYVIIPRNAKSEKDVIYIDTEPCHIFHFGTAEQITSNQLNFNAVCLDENMTMKFAQEIWLSNTDISPGLLFSYTLDLKALTSTRSQIDNASSEFPSTHPYRHGETGTRMLYLMANDRNEGIPYRDVVKVDSKTLKKTVWYSDGVIGEPVFAPRHGYQSNKYGAEDDGYVAVQLYRPSKHRTDFCVLDAQHIEDGPIARIRLKHHVPYGFHGTFTPEVFLAGHMSTKQLKSKL